MAKNSNALNLEQIKSDIKEKGFDITLSDIACVLLYKLTGNKGSSFAIGKSKDTWSLQSYYNASITFFKNPKIKLLQNYLEPVFIDFARTYTSENIGHFLDIIDTKRTYTPEQLPENVLDYVNNNPEKRSREDLELLLNSALNVLLANPKENAKMIADISVQLAKNFQPEVIEYNQVVVEEKYNDICPYCNHEISVKKGK